MTADFWQQKNASNQMNSFIQKSRIRISVPMQNIASCFCLRQLTKQKDEKKYELLWSESLSRNIEEILVRAFVPMGSQWEC
jgi:hypothetical protein